jgi:hypothetical protein
MAARKLAFLPAYGRLLRLYNICKAAGQGCMAMARVQYAQFGDLPLQLIAEQALFIILVVHLLSTEHKVTNFIIVVTGQQPPRACSLVSCYSSLVSCHCSLVSRHCS